MNEKNSNISGPPILALPVGRTNADDDTILGAFLEWIASTNIELYPAQEEAILEIMAGRHVILNTPTGSGKSLVALATHYRALCRRERSFYTCPIKALVSEKFFDLCRVFGPKNVGMLTGDASINSEASIICCTAEVLANMGLCEGRRARVNYVIMDEFHYYGDRDRGIAWQIPLLTLPRAIFLLMSATLGDTSRFEREIPEFTGVPLALVRGTTRPVPLEFAYSDTFVHETIERLVTQERSPIYIVNFTQRDCAEMAQNLTSMRLVDREQRQGILESLDGFRFDSSYGKDLKRFIHAGVGIHHAGLLPKYRLLVEKLSQESRLKVIVGTDTLGVGVNVPIRTVLFTKLCKYDGSGTKILTVRDFQQISGRAGRKGFDDRGWVVCQPPEHVLENQRLEAKTDKSGKKRKFTRKKPPDRGYVPWNESTFQQLQQGQPEPLNSNFSVDHGMILNLLQRKDAQGNAANGYRSLIELIASSHEREGRKSRLRTESAQLFRALRRAGIVETYDNQSKNGRQVRLAEGLQRDFSLFHTLGLFLLEFIENLESSHPDYALDLLSAVESILENPGSILDAQERKLKSDRVAELKQQGMEYEQRMEELDKVTYRKPNADTLYDHFNRFASKHPWVGIANVRPKSIARDMYESFSTFDGYTKTYGLQRIEGTLLRYLNQVYKALNQTVPDTYKDERIQEIIAWLRALIDRVDSSLVEEWQVLLHPPDDLKDQLEYESPKEIDISHDTRAFTAKVRAEMHRLVLALSQQDWEEAALNVASSPDSTTVETPSDTNNPNEPSTSDDTQEHTWTAKRFETEMQPFLEEHDKILFNHSSRMPDKTMIHEIETKLWVVQQTLVDPQEENLWFLEAQIDLRSNSNPEGPLLQMLRIST